MNLFFREKGSGFPFVIIHGLYGSSDNWMTIGKKLAKQFHVYMIDQRNHGQSPHSNEHSYELMKKDLSEFFEQQNIDKAIVMGHSMGGKTAMCFAADYPEKIKKLIIADIAPKDYRTIRKDNQYFLHNKILKAMLNLNFSEITSRMEIGNQLLEKIKNPQIVQFLLKNIQRNKEGLFKWKPNINVLHENLDEIISGINGQWAISKMPFSDYPALFIKGENSNYITEGDKETIKKLYTDSVIKTIPNAGHWLHAEQPHLFLETIEEFV